MRVLIYADELAREWHEMLTGQGYPAIMLPLGQLLAAPRNVRGRRDERDRRLRWHEVAGLLVHTGPIALADAKATTKQERLRLRAGRSQAPLEH